MSVPTTPEEFAIADTRCGDAAAVIVCDLDNRVVHYNPALEAKPERRTQHFLAGAFLICLS